MDFLFKTGCITSNHSAYNLNCVPRERIENVQCTLLLLGAVKEANKEHVGELANDLIDTANIAM